MTNKYLRTIYGVDKDGKPGSLQVDVYDILDAYPTKNPALDHLIKKALCPGQRGHKDLLTDLEDIIKSAQRAKELVVNQLACTTEVTIDNIPDDTMELLTSQSSVLKAAPIKPTTYTGPTTERPTSFSKLGTIYAFTNIIGGRRLRELQNAAEGVCAVSPIAHVLDAPIGAVVVGSYREHNKCVDGRHCFNMNEALAILQNDLGALAPARGYTHSFSHRPSSFDGRVVHIVEGITEKTLATLEHKIAQVDTIPDYVRGPNDCPERSIVIRDNNAPHPADDGRWHFTVAQAIAVLVKDSAKETPNA
ncbi:hypothetical protein [Aeromonas phage phiWae15]|nr:hypothetical protein [Aeromonas phage phiWae15]